MAEKKEGNQMAAKYAEMWRGCWADGEELYLVFVYPKNIVFSMPFYDRD